jgi:ABC-2 type transport system ATP-binding protein
MADVLALCKRVIVIDKGRILFDGPLYDLARRVAPFKVITMDLERDVDGYGFEALGEILSREGRKITLQVPHDRAPSVTARLLADLPVLDLTIEDPPIEDVIKRVFAGEGEAP